MIARSLAGEVDTETRAPPEMSHISCVRADIGPFARWGFDEPWVREAGLVCDVEASELGPYVRYSAEVTTERPSVLRGGFPAGQETHSILAELGYSSDEVAGLLATGAVAAPSG